LNPNEGNTDNPKEDEENIIINTRRKINVTNNGLIKININQNSDKDKIHLNTNENIDSNENKKDSKYNEIKINELEFENCNVYLKNINPDNNRPYSRKRSAFKYIENNLEKEKIQNANNFNSTSNLMKSLNLNDIANNTNSFQINNSNNNNLNFNSTKTSMNNLNSNTNNPNLININYNSNNNSQRGIKQIENKPKIMQQEKISQNCINDKKPEYESRRKKQINFINGIDTFPLNQTQSTNNNLQNFETQQKNLHKVNENNANTNNVLTGAFESRRILGSHTKATNSKENEGENNVNKKKNFLKI